MAPGRAIRDRWRLADRTLPMGQVMSGWKLPASIERFLRAVRANNADRLCAAIDSNAVVVVSGQELRGEKIRAWACQFCGPGPRRVLLVSSQWQDDRVLLLVLMMQTHLALNELHEWRFQTNQGEIRKIAIKTDLLPIVPHKIRTFVAATNISDLETLLSTFVDDAVVNDQLYEYWGRAAIREWARRDLLGERLKIEVITSVAHYHGAIIVALIRGDFDSRGLPDPLIFTMYFSLSANGIIQLIVVRNLAGM